ncbi:helix-turn-helix domain-containing protein [Streptomyces sp. NPDC059455]|uniref:helix-turn-helix domain-containing protein n=1 Tax=Streptomyces sp. NPDC059455 TaxID=3346837 RepID=UPI0036C64D29
MTANLKDLPRIPRGKRLTGNARERFRESVSVVYLSDPDVSIRDISDATGRSFGFIHTMLNEAGVELRRRGGAYPRDKTLET